MTILTKKQQAVTFTIGVAEKAEEARGSITRLLAAYQDACDTITAMEQVVEWVAEKCCIWDRQIPCNECPPCVARRIVKERGDSK